MVKCWERPLEREGHVKTQWNPPCMMLVWKLLCWIHVGEYLMPARLDYWVWSQNCRNTLPWYECSTNESIKSGAVIAGRDELSENSNPLLGWTFKGNPVDMFKLLKYWQNTEG